MKLIKTVICILLMTFLYINSEAGYSKNIAVERLARSIVVELFTSQGCSSCPPADKILEELDKKYDDVLVLSFHVDYWNYIGWKDPFSSSQNTSRQRNYNLALGLRRNYTPQMIIDGRLQAVGADRNTVIKHIKSAAISQQATPINMIKTKDALQIRIADTNFYSNLQTDILLVSYDNRRVTSVLRGENRGKEIANTNIVRNVRKIGIWKGKQVSLEISLPNAENIAILLQENKTRRIVGAASLKLVSN